MIRQRLYRFIGVLSLAMALLSATPSAVMARYRFGWVPLKYQRISPRASLPSKVSLDPSGADLAQACVPVITTVAGREGWGDSGDGGPALEAKLSAKAVAFDPAGNLYIVDRASSDAALRKVDTSGLISTVFGSHNSQFDAGITSDAQGNIYVVGVGDSSNGGGVRKVSPDGTVVKMKLLSVDVQRTSEVVSDVSDIYIYDVAMDKEGNLYLADDMGIQKVDAFGRLSTVIPKAHALHLAIDGEGAIYYLTLRSSENPSEIRKWTPNGEMTVVVGNEDGNTSGDGGPAIQAGVWPWNIAVDAEGNLYIADLMNSTVRKVNKGGIISTVAGKPNQVHNGVPAKPLADGEVANTGPVWPNDVAVDPSGNLYIAEGNSVRKVSCPPAALEYYRAIPAGK